MVGTDSASVIVALKTLFARHGILEILHSCHNGPQHSAEEFPKFIRSYKMLHITSSPRYLQSNSQVKRLFQRVKYILKMSGDPFLEMLSYRDTPLQVQKKPGCQVQ